MKIHDEQSGQILKYFSDVSCEVPKALKQVKKFEEQGV